MESRASKRTGVTDPGYSIFKNRTGAAFEKDAAHALQD
jgi:hypothetical protein